MNTYTFVFLLLIAILIAIVAILVIKLRQELIKRREHERWVKKQRYTP